MQGSAVSLAAVLPASIGRSDRRMERREAFLGSLDSKRGKQIQYSVPSTGCLLLGYIVGRFLELHLASWIKASFF